MEEKTPQVTIRCLVAVILPATIFTLPADAHYELDWHVIAGGGGTSTTEQYSITGTIGQAGVDVLAGEQYELHGGFWPGEACTCMGDMNEDGWISPSDISNMVTNLLAYASNAYWRQISQTSCGDMNWDGWLSPSDISAVVGILLPHKSNAYWLQCETW